MNPQKNSQKRVMLKRGYILILLCAVLICTIPTPVNANAPSALTVSYNLETQALQVAITHPVSDTVTHYIYKVEIKKNGIIYNTTTYTSQPDPNSFTYTYHVNATTGDTLEVTASCIQGGSKTIQYTIATNNGENKKSTPGLETSIVIMSIAFFLIFNHWIRKSSKKP
jgi:hypothetical protein